jgi:hypothetical protein
MGDNQVNIWRYTEPRNGELPIGTRVRVLLPHSLGELATIEAYHHEDCEPLNRYDTWYHIMPDNGFTPPSTHWIIHPDWFEVIE